MPNRTVLRAVASVVVLAGLSLFPPTQVARAQSMCSCEVCLCYRNRISTGECDVPATQCDCWKCPE